MTADLLSMLYSIAANGIAHVSVGLALGEGVRRLLHMKNSAAYRITDVASSLVSDISLLGNGKFFGSQVPENVSYFFKKVFGTHRSWLHDPLYNLQTSGAAALAREAFTRGRAYKSRLTDVVKNTVYTSAQLAGHTAVDILSGGPVPFLNYPIKLWEMKLGIDDGSYIVHSALTIASWSYLAYANRDYIGEKIKRRMKKSGQPAAYEITL